MNESFGEMKARLRRLEAMLTTETGRILANLEFARAVSQAQRLARDGDRSREPSSALRAAVARAEALGQAVR
jgi:hypothetical protein